MSSANKCSRRTSFQNITKGFKRLLKGVEREQKKLLQGEINTMKIQDTLQSELHNEIQEKTLLLQEHEDLKAAHKVNRETLTAELQAERRKVASLQCQLDKEVQSHAATVNEGCRQINDLKAEQEAQSQKMTEERGDLQRNMLVQHRFFERDGGTLMIKSHSK